MKIKTLALTFGAALIISFLFCGIIVQPAKSQSPRGISINFDGSITGTDKIQHNENVYTLTGNLYNLPIEVLCDNIVLDGGGFTLQGPGGYPTPAAINLTCTNVVIRNFNIGGWEVGVLGVQNSNVINGNNITGNERDIAVYADNYKITNNKLANAAYGVRIVGNNNIIFQNTVENSAIAFWITNSSGNIIVANDIAISNPAIFTTDFGGFRVYHNNFMNIAGNTVILIANSNVPSSTLSSWDNGYPSGGNYWSDYFIKYPNATEISNSGIGAIPYVVSSNPSVVDRYPLLSPVNISKAVLELPLPPSSYSPSPSPNLISSPSPSPTGSATQNPTINASAEPPQGDPFLKTLALAAIVIVAVIGAGLLVYFKKHKSSFVQKP